MVTSLMLLAFVLGLVAGRAAHGWVSERRQRERLRQVVNGGVDDMPHWLLLRERRK